MTVWAAVHLLAAASGLVVIALALSRGEHSPLRRPLAMLAASQFAWNAASVGTEVTDLETYARLGVIAAPLFPPLALHFVLTFIGKRRQLRAALVAAYVVFGAQAALGIAWLIVPFFRVPGGLETFALLLLGASAPLLVLGLVLVWRHLARASSELERLRTRLLLIALIIVPVLLITDLLADLGLPVPRMSTLGSFTFNVLLTRLTLGLGLFTGATRRGVAVGQAVVLGLFFAVAYLAIFSAFNGRLAVMIIAFTTLSLVFAVLGWLLITGSNSARAGLERFAALGRFSAQMAHDLRNPLAAAKGAAELLTEELRRKGDAENEGSGRLVVQQLDRLNTIIERYQRLSKLEPQFHSLDANQLVTRVLSLQGHAAGPQVTIEKQLATEATAFEGDGDLLASALENLVKNGIEAMPKGGTLTVATSLRSDADVPQVVISVKDTGTGFDPRALEQAFEMFFTTKASGSGLGLAFVRQVARAHGGDAALDSREGRGTTISLILPLTHTGDLP